MRWLATAELCLLLLLFSPGKQRFFSVTHVINLRLVRSCSFSAVLADDSANTIMRFPDSLSVGRRLVATLIASAPLHPTVLHAAAPPPTPLPFTLSVPEGFISFSSRDPSTLAVAGNFKTGTTLSVQKVDTAALQALLPSTALVCDGDDRTKPILSCTEGAAKLALALAAFRDRQAAPSGASSRVIVETLRADPERLSFEMALALVGDGATEAQQADPTLSRRTSVAVLPAEGADAWLCLWAGATTENWEAGDGETLRRAAASFALRKQ